VLRPELIHGMLVGPEYSSYHGPGSAFGQGFGGYLERGRLKEVLGVRITSEQRFHFAAKCFIKTGFLKKTAAGARLELASGVIDLLDLAPPVQS
jgi:hypothetical protein